MEQKYNDFENKNLLANKINIIICVKDFYLILMHYGFPTSCIINVHEELHLKLFLTE
jgi:hypothetical protein